MTWSPAAAQQAAAVAATQYRVNYGVDRCEAHPGVKWQGDRPCFVCDPEWWLEHMPLAPGTIEPGESVADIVLEFYETAR